jgi:hypothetical protein
MLVVTVVQHHFLAVAVYILARVSIMHDSLKWWIQVFTVMQQAQLLFVTSLSRVGT